MYNCPVISINLEENHHVFNSEKTESFRGAGRLCSLRLLRESLSPWSDPDHQRDYGSGGYGEMRRMREMCKRMSGKCDYGPGGGT